MDGESLAEATTHWLAGERLGRHQRCPERANGPGLGGGVAGWGSLRMGCGWEGSGPGSRAGWAAFDRAKQRGPRMGLRGDEEWCSEAVRSRCRHPGGRTHGHVRLRLGWAGLGV